ncbi:MAG: hypothetical protein FJ297_12025 [Planctomycetes bacterium]|nr:hypothetical protein [Planctomycetota bacterium]
MRTDRRSPAIRVMAAGLLGVCLSLGCGKGDAPSLNISTASTDGSGAPGTGSGSSESRLIGTWNGSFVMHADAATAEFDSATLTACKSMKIRIQFREGHAMAMTASMVLPEIGEKTNASEGRWEVLGADGDTITVRSTEDGADPEEIVMHFRGTDLFEMTPPNQLKALGTMRFTRE